MNAKKVKKRMLDYGLRQVEVANECGVSTSTVHDVVMGYRKSRKIMEFIAERTNTTVEDLFPRPKPKKRYIPSEGKVAV